MSAHPRRTLRMPASAYDAAAAWAGDYPERALWLRADEFRVGEGVAEHIVRESIRVPQGAAMPSDGARLFVLRWAQEPALVAALALHGLCESGAAGGIFMPAPGSTQPACGFFCHPRGAGVDGLDALRLAGAGLRQFDLSRWAERGTARPAQARPRPAWRLLAGLRIAIAGAAQGAALAHALIEQGARHLALLDDGGRVDLAALTTMEGLEPESIGQFKVDALADAIVARSGRAVVAHACGAVGLRAVLSRLAPDLVVCCEVDHSRRAVLAGWCAERQRVWIDIATAGNAGRICATAVASLSVHLPALRPTGDGCGAARRRSRDRFAELALPRVGTALADEPVTALALRQHSARAAMQAVHELLRGRVPLPVHIRVAAGAGGQARACIAEADDGDDGNADWGPVGAQFAAPAAAMH